MDNDRFNDQCPRREGPRGVTARCESAPTPPRASLAPRARVRDTPRHPPFHLSSRRLPNPRSVGARRPLRLSTIGPRPAQTGVWIFATILACVLVVGCGQVREDVKRLTLETRLSGYRQSIRWGYFPAAAAMLSPELRSEHAQDLTGFDNIRVTGYEVIQPATAGDDNEAIQLVQIEYVLKDRQRVERLADRQRWRYDEPNRTWWLASGLPKFQGTASTATH